MKAIRLLLSGLLCLSLATAGSGARAELLQAEFSSLPARNRAVEQLVAHGVDAATANERVRALTDAEVALVNAKFDELPSGAGGGDGLFALLLVAAAVYVVVQFWPFFVIGGIGVAAVKASKRA